MPKNHSTETSFLDKVTLRYLSRGEGGSVESGAVLNNSV
jgi:hypothetical protein